MSFTAIFFFVAIVGLTLVITWWASKRTSSAAVTSIQLVEV